MTEQGLLHRSPLSPPRGARLPARPADEARYHAALDLAVERSRERANAEIVAATSALLDDGRARVREAFEGERLGGLPAGRALAWLQDVATAGIFDAASALYPTPNPTASERLAVVAVGGYGRGALAPGSDVDLLFLTPYKRTAWTENVVETMLYVMWDLKLKVGQATRSVDECLRLAANDATIRTSLLETRLICGDVALYEELRDRLWNELFAKTGADFVAAKLQERRERHERAGDSRYLLEPNIKEGKGALRDLHSMFWIAKYLYHAENAGDLVEKGVFTAGEARKFHNAEAFLWTVRFWLHYLSGRASEQLTFDKQVEIAERMGFVGDEGQRAVERFMKRYFWVAKEVGDLTRIFCATLESQHLAPRRRGARALLGLLPGFGGKSEPLSFDHGRIQIADAEALRADPTLMLRVFAIAGRKDASVHPNTLKLIRRNLGLINAALRADPEANTLFLEILCDAADPERALRLMNEAGVLGRFMPEFGRIVCMMQFNMYHHYTVDEHTIRAVGNLARIERGELAEEAPVSTGIMRAGGVNRRVLFVALLLHDIGKGRAEDHSVLGARIAQEVCPRLGLSESETETVVWLVRRHLLMSDTAQKRDLSDIRTVRDFAALVQNRERLKLLMALTVCDVRAVGPGVWNGWKARLLRTLYIETEQMLSAGHDGALDTREHRVEAAKEALRERLSDWSEDAVARFLERHYPPYWLGLDAGTHEVHARMLAESDEEGLLIDASGDSERSATRLSVAMADHPGLFSRITGAVSLAGASIVDARSFTTNDGLALATLWLQDQDGEAYDDPPRLKRLRETVARTMRGEIRPFEQFERRTRVKPRERSFTVPPNVHFDNAASELYTVIEVTGRDRLGLVHDLARAIAEQKVSIFSAVIATYGERAVDTFYVKDLFGHKIASKARQAAIEKALYDALAAQG